jgi:hypothetical protein
MVQALIIIGIVYAIVYWVRKRRRPKPGESWTLISERESDGGEVRLFQVRDNLWIVQTVPTDEKDGGSTYRYKNEEKARRLYGNIRIR